MLYLLINRTSNSIIFHHLLSLLKDLNFRNLTKYSIKTYLFPFELLSDFHPLYLDQNLTKLQILCDFV